MADKDLSPMPCKSELETKFFEADINREHSDRQMRLFIHRGLGREAIQSSSLFHSGRGKKTFSTPIHSLKLQHTLSLKS